MTKIEHGQEKSTKTGCEHEHEQDASMLGVSTKASFTMTGELHPLRRGQPNDKTQHCRESRKERLYRAVKTFHNLEYRTEHGFVQFSCHVALTA